jgi:hypothetical protein
VGETFLAGMPADLGSDDEAAGLLAMVASMPMRRFLADLGVGIPAGELAGLAEQVARARAGGPR